MNETVEDVDVLTRTVRSVFGGRDFVDLKRCLFWWWGEAERKGVWGWGCYVNPALLLTQLVLVLLPETVPGGEEVPAPLLVHLPHVRLLQSKQGNVS